MRAVCSRETIDIYVYRLNDARWCSSVRPFSLIYVSSSFSPLFPLPFIIWNDQAHSSMGGRLPVYCPSTRGTNGRAHTHICTEKKKREEEQEVVHQTNQISRVLRLFPQYIIGSIRRSEEKKRNLTTCPDKMVVLCRISSPYSSVAYFFFFFFFFGGSAVPCRHRCHRYINCTVLHYNHNWRRKKRRIRNGTNNKQRPSSSY